ncbi:hypothetical protein [Pseudomonas sp. GZD-222]|uniref:hypothetical protein n=1 Tax=Pseudomonas sp. GZD-222 TaxID=3404805 RepID=UPI003BB6B8E7
MLTMLRPFKNDMGKLFAAFLAAVAFLATIPVSVNHLQPIIGGSLLIGSSTVLLALVIIAPLKRMQKGGFLLGIAVLTLSFKELCLDPVYGKVPSDTELLSSWTGWSQAATLSVGASVFKVLVNFINLACAGAGGSLIAVESDRTATEAPLHKPQTASSVRGAQASDAQPILESLCHKVDTHASELKALDRSLEAIIKQQQASNRMLLIICVAVPVGITLVLVLAATLLLKL